MSDPAIAAAEETALGLPRQPSAKEQARQVVIDKALADELKEALLLRPETQQLLTSLNVCLNVDARAPRSVCDRAEIAEMMQSIALIMDKYGPVAFEVPEPDLASELRNATRKVLEQHRGEMSMVLASGSLLQALKDKQILYHEPLYIYTYLYMYMYI
jgi:hypothetical protein